MSFLINLAIKYWRPIASFLAMAVFLGWIAYQGDKIDRLTQKLRASEAAIASYESSLVTLQSDADAKIKALEEETQREITRTKNQERLIGQIKGASDDQDAPAAPVLRGTIDRLYGRTTNTD